MKTQQARVYIRNGYWFAETDDKRVHKILDQDPFHAVLSIGRHENRLVMVEVLDGPLGSAAEFKSFV